MGESSRENDTRSCRGRRRSPGDLVRSDGGGDGDEGGANRRRSRANRVAQSPATKRLPAGIARQRSDGGKVGLGFVGNDLERGEGDSTSIRVRIEIERDWEAGRR